MLPADQEENLFIVSYRFTGKIGGYTRDFTEVKQAQRILVSMIFLHQVGVTVAHLHPE